MTCKLGQDLIKKVVDFHGHLCPGLAYGIRAAEVALLEVGSRSEDEELVAVTETDMCGADAIQVLTGCTFGKGNFIFLDHGKMAFSFFNRENGKNIRIRVSPHFRSVKENRDEKIQEIMDAPIDTLFVREVPDFLVPEKAHRLPSLICSKCQESTMETRCRLFQGAHYCVRCFDLIERRVSFKQ